MNWKGKLAGKMSTMECFSLNTKIMSAISRGPPSVLRLTTRSISTRRCTTRLVNSIIAPWDRLSFHSRLSRKLILIPMPLRYQCFNKEIDWKITAKKTLMNYLRSQTLILFLWLKRVNLLTRALDIVSIFHFKTTNHRKRCNQANISSWSTHFGTRPQSMIKGIAMYLLTSILLKKSIWI